MNSDYGNLCARGASFIGLASVVLALAMASGVDARKRGDGVQQATSCAMRANSSISSVAKCRAPREISIASENLPAPSDRAIVFAEALSQATAQ